MSENESVTPAVIDENVSREIAQYPDLAAVDFGAAWCSAFRMIAPVIECERTSPTNGTSLTARSRFPIRSGSGIRALPASLSGNFRQDSGVPLTGPVVPYPVVSVVAFALRKPSFQQ